MDKLLTVKSKSQKPPKPTAKPTAKPRLKPKPNLKSKPTPKPRFVEAGAGEDELFGTTGDAKDKNITSVKERVPNSGDQDLFDQARKSSFRFVTLTALHLTRIFFIIKKKHSEYVDRRSEPFFLQIPHRIVQIRVPAGVIILLHDHYTLTGPLSTPVNKSQLGNLKG